MAVVVMRVLEVVGSDGTCTEGGSGDGCAEGGGGESDKVVVMVMAAVVMVAAVGDRYWWWVIAVEVAVVIVFCSDGCCSLPDFHQFSDLLRVERVDLRTAYIDLTAPICINSFAAIGSILGTWDTKEKTRREGKNGDGDGGEDGDGDGGDGDNSNDVGGNGDEDAGNG
jgi:hypothetical protein